MLDAALFCLALAVYHESRQEVAVDQMDVAHIVMNRVYDSQWPDDVCGVVYQLGKAPDGGPSCAFSWYCDGVSDIPHESRVFGEIKTRVGAVLLAYRVDPTNGATHFHSEMGRLPYWAHRLEAMGQRGPFWHYR